MMSSLESEMSFEVAFAISIAIELEPTERHHLVDENSNLWRIDCRRDRDPR